MRPMPDGANALPVFRRLGQTTGRVGEDDAAAAAAQSFYVPEWRKCPDAKIKAYRRSLCSKYGCSCPAQILPSDCTIDPKEWKSLPHEESSAVRQVDVVKTG